MPLPTVDENLRAARPCLWVNPARVEADEALRALPIHLDAIEEAEARWRRFAPLIAKLFPETAAAGGLIESDLIPVPHLQRAMMGGSASGTWLIKGDHALPIAGSIKARGGIHEVLEFAERIARQHGLLDKAADYTVLAEPAAREVFARYVVAVGSTGNLGLSIGVIASALGFRAQVHMSAEAKQWKKQRLRQRGVEVIEHAGDYGEAVEAGRRVAQGDAFSYFVDDERSLSLFLGYSVAALRLRDQLRATGIAISSGTPLFVYLPCGVGGAPSGITFGLKQVFGDHVHCFFAEPVASPCVLAQMSYPERPGITVYDLGLDNRTDADGLAVARASELAVQMMTPLLSGIFTVEDDALFRQLALLHESEGIRIEPSAAAGIGGPHMLLDTENGRQYLADNGLTQCMSQAVHLIWTTGGLFVPDEEYRAFLERGRRLLSAT
ncbi:MAG TPA: D-serine ammonia-lyase [Noviherbaspirillum sp.]|uniref:D-serine ammonia-lyase n=1 Tax=Noviherbaspirillum sp. TaxID=1926288 RepID=UPI002B495B59|nr:D-serine ammonia-lyase [Noviherbaspirillum sp.]HJV87667.1 D-serine ammonia-lyase [Noviherbaspirillum sp.]